MSLYVSVWDGKKIKTKELVDVVARNFQFKDTYRDKSYGNKVRTKTLAWIGVLWFNKKRKDWLASSLDNFRRQSRKAVDELVRSNEYDFSAEFLARMISDRVEKDKKILKERFDGYVDKALDW